MASTKLNYRNDTLVLGFSDLKRLFRSWARYN